MVSWILSWGKPSFESGRNMIYLINGETVREPEENQLFFDVISAPVLLNILGCSLHRCIWLEIDRNIELVRTVHNLCMICCVNVNVKYHHPMHLKLPWIHGSPIFTPAVLTSAKFPFLCEFCIILMERPRLNLRSQYWAIWPNLEASSRLGTEIMENSSWEVRPSLPSTRRGRFPGSQRHFFSFCSSRCSFEVSA